MLVLARKVGQQIIIGDEIEVTVLEVRGEQVRLGINAPRTISIHRKELLTQVATENVEAATVRKEDLSALADAIKAPVEEAEVPAAEPEQPA